jgi:hypothetical protein
MGLFWKHRISDSISVRPAGRDVVEYRDGDRRMEINAERLGGNPRRIVYTSSIARWLPPHEHETLDADAKEQILENILKCFEMNGVNVVTG